MIARWRPSFAVAIILQHCPTGAPQDKAKQARQRGRSWPRPPTSDAIILGRGRARDGRHVLAYRHVEQLNMGEVIALRSSPLTGAVERMLPRSLPSCLIQTIVP